MIKTTDALTDAYAKLSWAGEHINSLIAAMTNGEQHTSAPESDADAHPYDHFFRPLSAEIPTTLAFIAGDAIHNTRTALDYLMSALATASGHANKHPTFPICRDEEQLRRHVSMKSISTVASEFITRQQPYVTGCDRLWWLHHLDIVDKHRKISLLEHGPPEAVFIRTNLSNGGGDWYMLPNYWIEEASGAPRQSAVVLLEEMITCAKLVLDSAKAEFFSM